MLGARAGHAPQMREQLVRQHGAGGRRCGRRRERRRDGRCVGRGVRRLLRVRLHDRTAIVCPALRLHVARERRSVRRTRAAERARVGTCARARRTGGLRGMRSRARLRDHPDAVARTQRDRRARVERLPRHGAQIDVLRDDRDQHAHLQQRGLVADAFAHPAAEREIRILVPRGRVRRETLGIERIGMAPQRRMPMRDVRRQEHRRAGRHVIAADFVVVDEVAREAPDRRIDAQHLVDGLQQIRQPLEIVRRRRAAAEHRVEFVAQASQHVRMLRERVQPPRHPTARRFVTGQQHRHHLVVHFALGQRRARLGVARGEQQRDHVARRAAARAMPGDDRVDDRVDRLPRMGDAPVERRRHPARHEVVQVALRHHRFDAEPHRGADVVRMPGEVCVEQHQPEHAQAHVHHRLDDVERCVGVRPREPLLDERERRVADRGRMRVDLLAMKKRLHDAPMAPPELAVGRQQPVAEEHPEVVVEAAAHVVAMVVLQHVLHAVRMRERVRDERPEPVAHDVAVLLLQLQQHRDRIALVRGEVAHHEAAARAGSDRFPAHADTCPSGACTARRSDAPSASRSASPSASRSSTSVRDAKAPVVRFT
ncbi:hypothetical protein FEP41_05399 [Burkholderia multivorans]|nr:hypothetical protein [Burkholderia multivorans]